MKKKNSFHNYLKIYHFGRFSFFYRYLFNNKIYIILWVERYI